MMSKIDDYKADSNIPNVKYLKIITKVYLSNHKIIWSTIKNPVPLDCLLP